MGVVGESILVFYCQFYNVLRVLSSEVATIQLVSHNDIPRGNRRMNRDTSDALGVTVKEVASLFALSSVLVLAYETNVLFALSSGMISACYLHLQFL